MRSAVLPIAILVAAAAPALAQTTPPAEWTCTASFYGGDDGCDCGCGAPDPDCADNQLSTCQYAWCTTDGEVPTAANPSLCAPNTCGDSVVGGTEVCDAGGAAGCATDCSAVTEGWVCGGLYFDRFSGCHQPVCGDGIIDGEEACEDDDGASPQSGDGCSATCTLEDGFACGLAGQACTAIPPGWTCTPGYYGDGGCDCGCGAADSDCSPGCTEPGCTDASCAYCYDASGAFMSCTGEGEGEGEGEPGEGEGEPGEGEGEGDDNRRDDGVDPDPSAAGCASTRVSTGLPPALALLLGAALIVRRRRR